MIVILVHLFDKAQQSSAYVEECRRCQRIEVPKGQSKDDSSLHPEDRVDCYNLSPDTVDKIAGLSLEELLAASMCGPKTRSPTPYPKYQLH